MKSTINCQICGMEPLAIVKIFAHEPFIDGRNYELICFTCANVPKTWEYTKDGSISHWGYHDPDKLKTVKEMMEDGFDEKEALVSIRAIQKLLKNPRIILGDEYHIFNCLYLDDIDVPILS